MSNYVSVPQVRSALYNIEWVIYLHTSLVYLEKIIWLFNLFKYGYLCCLHFFPGKQRGIYTILNDIQTNNFKSFDNLFFGLSELISGTAEPIFWDFYWKIEGDIEQHV